MRKNLNENDIEQFTLDRLQELGWEYIEPLVAKVMRDNNFSNVILSDVLKEKLTALNPHIGET